MSDSRTQTTSLGTSVSTNANIDTTSSIVRPFWVSCKLCATLIARQNGGVAYLQAAGAQNDSTTMTLASVTKKLASRLKWPRRAMIMWLAANGPPPWLVQLGAMRANGQPALHGKGRRFDSKRTDIRYDQNRPLTVLANCARLNSSCRGQYHFTLANMSKPPARQWA